MNKWKKVMKWTKVNVYEGVKISTKLDKWTKVNQSVEVSGNE